MTVPDNTCIVRLSEDTELGYKKEICGNVNIEVFLPEINEKNCSLEEITLCL